MTRGAKIGLGVLGALALLAVLALIGVLIVSQTDWGREQVRQIALDQLENAVEGEVQIGRVEGDLLRGIRLVDVSITDTEGRPFLSADTISTRYSLWSLVRQRIVLNDLRLVRPVIVLDQPPGEKWNYVRIFQVDTVPREEPERRGWGDWILLQDVEIVQGWLTVRSEWTPPDTLPPAEQEKAIALALSDESRENIQRVPGGFQNIMEFRRVNTRLPTMRVADPDTDEMLFEVASLSGTMLPFRPPAAEVRDLSGEFILGQDSLHFRGIQAVLPGSRLAAEGVYVLESADMFLALHGSPVALADLRWLYPPLPEEGGGTLRLTMQRELLKTSFVAEEMDLRVDESALAGKLGLVIGDSVRLHDTDLRFSNLETGLIERLVPELELPRQGTLTGQLSLAGSPAAMQVDGDVTFADYRAGVNRVVADGVVGMEDEIRFRNLRLRFEPLRTDLVREQAPQLPPGGTITGTAVLDGSASGPLRVDGNLALRDPRTGVSRVAAAGGVAMGDEVAFQDLRVRFDPLQAELVRTYLPDLPRGGTLAGNVQLNGSPARLLQVNGQVAHRHPELGVSRVALDGGIGMADRVRFRDLDVRLDPLRMELVRALVPDLPLGGTLTGSARLNGSPESRLLARADLVHVEGGERSHLIGRAEIAGEEWAAVDLRLEPLSLVTVGRFAPGAGLRNQVTGTVQAQGNLRNLALRADLRLPDGGEIATAGTLDLASEQIGYDLDTRLQVFNLETVTAHAPAATSLTGAIEAQGRGFDPATMRAQISADLAAAQVDEIEADEVRLRLAVAEGLATLEPARVRLGPNEILAEGTFGLVAGRQGELSYRVAIDSLHTLAPYLPADTGVVAPRPAAREAALARVRAAQERLARAREVERRATGRTPPPPPRTELPLAAREIPRDSLAGSLHAAGTLRGNLERFDLLGRAEMEEVIFQGNYVGSGRAEYALRDFGTPQPAVELEAAFDSLLAAGFALDSAAARIQYRGDRYGEGRAILAIYQDDETDYRADVEFALSLERSEVRLHETALRFDTVTWESTRPGVVSWANAGIEVETIELQSDAGGRIFVDGRLPVEAPADLEVVIQDLQIAHVAALLQDDVEASGILSLDARIQGTQRSPRFQGDVALLAATYEGRRLPDLHGTFGYANQELTADAELLRGGQVLAVAEGRLPIDLALADQEGPRLLDRPLALDIRADSIALDALPSFTDQVSEIQGRVVGNISVRGTFEDPEVSGIVNLDLASFRIEPLGVRFEEIAGTVRMEGETLFVDSLVAWSRGPVRIEGTLDMASLTEPGFDLQVRADNALVMNNDQGRLQLDAELEVEGPFDGVRVTGDVRTRSAVIYLPETTSKNVVSLEDLDTVERIDTLLLAERDVLVERSPLLENLRVDVNLHIARDTWVRSTDANVEIYTPEEVGPLAIHMDQAAGRLTLEGTVNTDFGEYAFMGRRFQLTRGAATFMGGPELDPLLQVAAEHEVRIPGREALSIRIVISGTVMEPTITLESNAQPPISQTDLLSYLAFGRPASSLLQQQGSSISGQGTGSGELVGDVAALASRQLTAVFMNTLVDRFESDAARSLGLDVFRVTPADLPAEIGFGGLRDVLLGTEIEAGRYVRPRLFAAAQARPTLVHPGARLEYRTPDGFRWVTSFEPQFRPLQPTLDPGAQTEARSVFGLFLIREWRF